MPGFNAQDLDDAIANVPPGNPALGPMLTEFRELRNWCRQRWITKDESIIPPETWIEAQKEQKELDHGRPWNG